MKIIISPSKTYSLTPKFDLPGLEPRYLGQSKQILKELQTLTKSEFKRIMKINDQLLDQTFNNIKGYNDLDTNHAIAYYTGFVYKCLSIDDYTEEMTTYMQKHLQILSAFYGMLSPFDLVKPYRLDMTMSLPNLSLNKFWTGLLSDELSGEQIINLASSEFSQLIKQPMITILFLENKAGVYKNISTYSKQARGYLLDFMIQNKIVEIEDIKSFTGYGYSYSHQLSDQSTWAFIRG